MSRTDAEPTPRTPTGSTWLRAGALAATASVVGNLVVLGVADVGDASLAVTDGGTVHDIAAGGVVVASLVPVAAAVALVAVAALRWFGVVRLAQVVGGTFALLSVAGPLAADTDTGTSIALAAMHVVSGAAFVIGLEVARRRIVAARRTPTAAPARTTGDAPPIAA